MIVILCLPCSFAVRVMPASVASTSSVRELEQLVGRQSDFWPDKFPCPRCNARATGILEREADSRALALMDVQEATPHEAYAAFNGLGFPSEQKCSLETVEALMKEQPLRRIIGTNVTGMERTIVDAFELWDGTRVHLGAAAEGAIIYRITRPVSYVKQTESKA